MTPGIPDGSDHVTSGTRSSTIVRMTAARVLADALRRSGLSKRELCTRAGLSRALLDDYLKGAKEPSYAQVDRIVRAAGLRLEAALRDAPPRVSDRFVAVLEFGQLFPRRPREPLAFPTQVFRRAR